MTVNDARMWRPRNRFALAGFVIVIVGLVVPLLALLWTGVVGNGSPWQALGIEIVLAGSAFLTIPLDVIGVLLAAIGLARRRGRRDFRLALVAVIVGAIQLVVSADFAIRLLSVSSALTSTPVG